MDTTEQATTPALVELQPQITAVVRARVPRAGLSAFLGEAYGHLSAEIAQSPSRIVGAPFGKYTPVGDEFDVEAGFPVDAPLPPTPRTATGRLPGGQALTLLHVGAYDHVHTAYATGYEWMLEHHYEADGEPWESYLDEPDVPRPRTLLIMPCSPLAPVAGLGDPLDTGRA